MNPIFREYCEFLKDKVNLDLEEGYYWLDNSIIKTFDKEGNIHKLYRIVINDEDLSMAYKVPKGYSKGEDIDIASWDDVVEMNKEIIRQKEKESLELIAKVLSDYKDYSPQILTSGGKDSSVTMHLVRKVQNNVHAIFNNTSLDCADTYLHIKREVDNVQIINPKEGFYQWRERLQFVPTRFSRACCTIFKEGAMIDVLPHDEKYLFFLGMRNEESSTRSDYGDMWRNNKWCDNWQGCLPIRKWTELDIWLYIMMEDISFNPKYRKGYSRAGCAICCPFSAKSTWVLDKYWYPTMRSRWENILKDDFINNSKWLVLNCTLDEYINQAWNGGVFREEPTEEVIKEYAEYSHLDENVARQYFNKYCANGCKSQSGKLKKIKAKDVIGMNMKLHGRNINKFYCKKCLMKLYDMDKEKWNSEVERFKQQGCDLF